MKKFIIGIGGVALSLLVGASAANAMTPATQSATINDLQKTIAISQMAQNKSPKMEKTNGYMPFNPYGNVNTFGFPFMYGMYPYGMGNFGYGNGYGGYMNGVRAPITNRWISNIDTYRLNQLDDTEENAECPECKRITWQSGPFVMHSWVYGDCYNCTNCENCLFCEDCEDCENCFNCKDCKNCTNIANAIGWVNNEPCEDCIPYDENEESNNVDEGQTPQTLEIKSDEVVKDNLLETHATEIQPRAPQLTKDIKEPAEYLNQEDNIATMDENSIFNENEHENNKALTS